MKLKKIIIRIFWKLKYKFYGLKNLFIKLNIHLLTIKIKNKFKNYKN